MVIAVFLLILGFLDYPLCFFKQTHNLTILSYLVGLVLVISLPVGWLAYQLFEELAKPHTNTRAFYTVKRFSSDLEDEEYLPLIDFCLRDMYKKYEHLPNTVEGYWNNYYARCIVCWGVLCVSVLVLLIYNIYFHTIIKSAGFFLLLLVIILFIFSYWLWIHETSRLKQYTSKHELESKRNYGICDIQLLTLIFTPIIFYFLYFILFTFDTAREIIIGIYLLYLGFIVFICITSSRISEEVGNQEYLYIRRKKSCIRKNSKSFKESDTKYDP